MEGVLRTVHVMMARCLPRTRILWLLMFAVSCGRAESDAPDSSTDNGHDLTIELFKHVPFVQGDTESAPLLAVADGDGVWTAVSAQGGVYHVHLMSERYGVAIACRRGVSSFVDVFHRTVEDGLDLRTRSCGGEDLRLDVTVYNVPTSSIAYVSTTGGFSAGGNYTYSFLVQPGSTEVFATLSEPSGRISTVVRVPAFDTETRHSISIDFANQGTAPEDHAVSMPLASGESARLMTTVIRPTGDYRLQSPVSVNGTPATYQTLPVALRQADDLLEVTVEVGSRSSSVTSKVPEALAVQFPADISAQAPALVAEPFLRPVFSFATTPTDLRHQTYVLRAETSRAPDDARRTWRAELSMSWIAGARSVRYDFPDLSTLPGFSTDLLLFDRGPVRWEVRCVETNATTAVDGRIVRSAARSGAIEGYCGDHSVQAPESCDPPDGTTCSASCTKL